MDATKEENQPFHGMEDSVLELVADGAMEDASLALTAREAAGITFLTTASAAFFAGTDMLMSFSACSVGRSVDAIDLRCGCSC